ncbi:hypothetical protein [Legionella waltersii]|uniref:Uncharacterized protein n=1 Tax=Legionella waltersii TaxID=66969 RepID=A0A0W1A2T7_9GAMM|nr:hypothetical protein [Legionella waltersii]KTD75692.1 hypothetical protein Lwal_2630 [Legionella waltersii]SNU99390.1 Uncharacterised protein [Legionella waltersii]
MPSVFELIGIKGQQNFTPIPQLGINSYLSTLETESQKYFFIEREAQAADGNQLGIRVVHGQDFLTSKHDHIDFISKCTALVKEKSAQLKSVDLKLMASVGFAVTATALSFLPVIGFIGWIGWAATAYYISQRATAYAEYHEALKLLVGACNWSLGQGPDDRKDTTKNLTGNETIRHMMAELYPVLTKTQVKHLIADDIEEIFAKELDEYESKFQLGFNPNRLFSNKDDIIALSKKGAEFKRCIYGFNKGGFTDFLDAIASIIPDLYNATMHGIQKLKYWWNEKSHSAAQDKVESHPENAQKASMN